MSLESDLLATLGPLFSGRVYPVEFPKPATASQAPDAPRWPACRYYLVDGVPVADICGDGDEETDEVRYQLDIVSHAEAGYTAHRAKVKAVRAAMSMFPVPASIETYSDEPLDTATNTYRYRIDYVLHGSSTT